ncbi:MmgE/PrpD family protein [Lichenicoccus sp.]|uniref:MmgE/PrpD family protein n=1 Tax=Lichenicoccus sp. TaxID=2781899 RepID=UPI003D0DFD44
MIGLTDALAEYAATVRAEDLPREVLDRAGALALDLIGNIIRARHSSESTPALLSAVKILGTEGREAHVFSDPATYSSATAALINGTLGHSLDFDDTHAVAVVHPGATVIPAALAAGEATGASGASVAAAIVAGYEVALRLSLALPAGAHYQRGFHPSATCGAFGAAAAAGRVYGLSRDQMMSAFGVVLSQTSGSLQFLANGAWTKRFQVGWASLAGMVAATLAREGFIGASQALEGKHGFLNSYGDPTNPGRFFEDLGRKYELMAVGVKPYPSCRWGHAGIDAALWLRKEHDFDVDAIDEIQLGLSQAGMLLIGSPADQKSRPANIVDAQFSGPFVIATALLTGKVDWNSFGLLGDARLQRLMSKVGCINAPEIEAEFPEHMAALVNIRFGTRSVQRKVIDPSGEPANFPTRTELCRKFAGLAAGILSAAEIDHLQETILRFYELDKIGLAFSTGAGQVKAA